MKSASPIFNAVLWFGLLVATQNAKGELLVYEAFDYPPGTSIAGQSGGPGWTNAWATGSSQGLATNVAGSLGYADVNGRSLQTFAGSIIVGNPVGTIATTANPNRALPGNLSGGANTTAGAGRTNWLSFLYQRLNFIPGPYFRQANLGLFEAGGERAAVGSPNTSATNFHLMSLWGSGVHNNAMAFQSPEHPIVAGATCFVLMKIVTDGAATADTAYVWFNWTNLLVEPPLSTATLTNDEVNLSGVNILRLQAGNANTSGSNAVWQADELRLGTTFADVTPSVIIGAAPFINSPPASQTVTIGEPVNFVVNAGGSLPLAYQWHFNTNTPLPGATNATMTIASAQPADAGAYHVSITNSQGAVTSSIATLTVQPPAPPEITTQPVSPTVVAGYGVNLSVGASGHAPLRYQWRFGAVPLAKETNSILGLTNVQTNNAGSYSVVITNIAGAITSSPAILTVIDVGPTNLPVFPGADGAAKFISGGRGGIVYHVTKLNSQLDDPLRESPGTLLYGLNSANFPPGPRTIVFDVAGVFHLGIRDTTNWTSGGHAWDATSRQSISASDLTIAGQTAPGPVIIMGGTLKPSGVNLVIRNLTIAAGYGMKSFWEPDDLASPAPGTLPTSFTMDAIDVSGQDVMLDHIDALFASDEAISCNEKARDLTIQYCLSAQGQNYDGHGYGHLLQPDTDFKLSYLHNLDAHLSSRLPRVGSEVGTGSLNDFRNNVTYNWFGSGPGYAGGNQYSKNNFIQNFYLAGAGGDSSWNSTAGGGTGIFNGSSAAYTAVYASGNVRDADKDGDPNDSSSADGLYASSTIIPAAYDIGIGVTLEAKASFTNVLRYVGSRWWERDYDFTSANTNAINTPVERLIREVFTGTGRIEAWADDPYDANPNEGAEWRSLWALRADANGVAPFNRPLGWDTDNDGMPDVWETAHGLDPYGANHNADFDADSYTDLEEYLNEVAAWPAPGVIQFTGEADGRFARIFNWRVLGQAVNITNLGSNATFSHWQPSRYDAAVISNRTVTVDAVGQHAGILRLTNNATLNITHGWLNVATRLENNLGCTLAVSSAGRLISSNLMNQGTLRLSGDAGLVVSGAFTNTGTLDVMTWNGTLPGGLVNTGSLLDRSLIRIASAGVSGTNFQVRIHGYAGHNYQLQYRNDLTGGLWQNVGTPVAGADAPIDFTHTNGAAAPQRYYHVIVD